jgi:hypothetical protein
MSYLTKAIPVYNQYQNIIPINQSVLNYSQNSNRIPIPQGQILHKNNSYSYINIPNNKVQVNPSQIITTTSQIIPSQNSTTVYNNIPKPIKILKKSFRRQPIIPRPLQISYSQPNFDGNINNLQKSQSYANINQASLYTNRVSILEESKNDLSLPIQNLPPNDIQNSYQPPIRNKKIFDKFQYSLTERNKLNNPNIQYINKYDNNINLYSFLNNIPKNNNDDINKNNMNLNKTTDLDGKINIALDSKMNQSMSNLTNNYFNTNNTSNTNLITAVEYNTNNNIPENRQINNYNNKILNNSNSYTYLLKKSNNENFNNKVSALKKKILSYKEVSNDDYCNNNINYFNSYNGNNYTANNIYNLNNNLNIMKFAKLNTIMEELEPENNFNLAEFIKLGELGKGTEGIIYLVKWARNNKKYALKRGRIQTLEFVQSKQEELKMIKDFRDKTGNDGIIRTYGQKIVTNKNGLYDFYEIMEYAEKDWEQEIIDRARFHLVYKENELLAIMAQIINTFALLQKNHITHRDIKPQNIMLVKGKFKITDFGNARLLKKEGYCIQRVRGSEMFMSPIMFKGLHSSIQQVKHNTYKSDVFSLGMCFLLAAALSYSPLNDLREIYDNNTIYNIVYNSLKNRYSQNFINIIMTMLQVEENLRPDFIQLESLFPH